MKKQILILLLTTSFSVILTPQEQTQPTEAKLSLNPAIGIILGVASAMYKKILPTKIKLPCGNTINKPDYHGFDPQKDFIRATAWKALDGYFAGHVADYLHKCYQQEFGKKKK